MDSDSDNLIISCSKCGIKFNGTMDNTCPISKVHSGTVIWENVFYSTGEKGGYYTNMQKWSCCGALHAPPCSIVYGPHDFRYRRLD